MRARIFAFLLLCLLIWVPVFVYWYVMQKNIASLTVSVESDTEIVVTLNWTFSFSWLPLADKILRFEKKCTKTCIFSPLPPARYDIEVFASGAIPQQDTFSLSLGEEKQLSYTLIGDIQIEPIMPYTDSGITLSLIENANSNFSWSFSPIGAISSNRVYALQKDDTSEKIGLLTMNQFIPLFESPSPSQRTSFDFWKTFFLTESTQTTIAQSLDGLTRIEIPRLWIQTVVPLERWWKIATSSWVFLFDDGVLSANPRFTDFLDITPTDRIGYIASTDTEKLQLWNFQPGISVLVRLNRSTGEVSILEQGIDIAYLYFLDGIPVFSDSTGKVYSLKFSDF